MPVFLRTHELRQCILRFKLLEGELGIAVYVSVQGPQSIARAFDSFLNGMQRFSVWSSCSRSIGVPKTRLRPCLFPVQTYKALMRRRCRSLLLVISGSALNCQRSIAHRC
jgi:hypothetical protein